MNILLWILQTLLALHTAIGAVWKFSHSAEQTMPSLQAISPGLWQAMSFFELACALALVIPALIKSLRILAPLAAIGIAVEMLAFCGLHLSAGGKENGPIFYWLIVAAVCAFIVYGRMGKRA